MSNTPVTTHHIWNQSLHVIDIKHLHGKIFSDITERGIKKILGKGESVVIFVNKKGLHTGMVCKDCGHIPYCGNCDIPIWLFQNNHEQIFWLCPVCQETYQIMNSCPSCSSNKLMPYGIGIQQAAQYCKTHFTANVITIQSSNANSYKKIEHLFEQLQIKPSVILATSLLQFPITDNIGMLIFQNAIQASIPDYNTEYQNYLFLSNTVRSYKTKDIILQTYQPDHQIIQSLITDNPKLFYDQDTHFRQKHHYPPCGELCIISYKHPVEKSLFTQVNGLFHDMLALRQTWWYNQIDIYAIPAMVYKIYGKYRYQIIVKWPQIREFIDQVFTTLKPFQKWFKFDRGAQSFF